LRPIRNQSLNPVPDADCRDTIAGLLLGRTGHAASFDDASRTFAVVGPEFGRKLRAGHEAGPYD
jgi:hypothetical protein